jgi:protein-arginine kinase activator protein McsA
MKCTGCHLDFQEKEIQESHDVPCYLFYNEVGRSAKKQKADKYSRRWLCPKCHSNYEKWLSKMLIGVAEQFSKCYFKEDSNE